MSQGRMTLPNVPAGLKIADAQGVITPEFESLFIQLLGYLQTNLSNEGSVAPPLTTVQIALLTNALNGTIVYNSTTDKGMIREAGTFVNIV